MEAKMNFRVFTDFLHQILSLLVFFVANLANCCDAILSMTGRDFEQKWVSKFDYQPHAFKLYRSPHVITTHILTHFVESEEI
jgi:hypothetical protein